MKKTTLTTTTDTAKVKEFLKRHKSKSVVDMSDDEFFQFLNDCADEGLSEEQISDIIQKDEDTLFRFWEVLMNDHTTEIQEGE